MESDRSKTNIAVVTSVMKVDPTPGGQSEYRILTAQLIIVLLIGNTATAADALQQFVLFFGALDSETPEQRLIIVHRLSGMAISYTLLLGFPLYLLLHQALGPRFMCIFGIWCHSFGYVLLLGTSSVAVMHVSITVFAISACCILCSSLSIACQFPRNINLILCAFGVAFEASPMVTHLFRAFVVQFGEYAKMIVLILLALQAAVCTAIAINHLPLTPFNPPVIVPKLVYRASLENAKQYGLDIPIQQFLKQKPMRHRLPEKRLQSDPARLQRIPSPIERSTSSPLWSQEEVNTVEGGSQALKDRFRFGQLGSDDLSEDSNDRFPWQRSYSIQGPSTVEVLDPSEPLLTGSLHHEDFLLLHDLDIFPTSIQYVPRKLLPKKWVLSRTRRILTSDFWVFLTFFAFSFIRRKHFIVCIRGMFQENSSLDSYWFHWKAFLFINLLSICGVFLIIWGVYVKKYGAAVTMVISHGLGTIGTACMGSSIPIAQDLGMLPLLLHLSSVTGLAGAFCNDTFGFRDYHTAGVLTTIAGMISLFHDLIWSRLTIEIWQSFRYSNLILFALSSAMFTCPLALLLFSARGREPVLHSTTESKDLSYSSDDSETSPSISSEEEEEEEDEVEGGARNARMFKHRSEDLEDYMLPSSDKLGFVGELTFPEQERNPRRQVSFHPRVSDTQDNGEAEQKEGTQELGDKPRKSSGDGDTFREPVSEAMFRTASQIKFFESVFPLLPMYDRSSATAIAEQCIAEKIIDEWKEI